MRLELTFPTKVPSDSLGWIGSLKRTSDKSLFPMALGSYGHRITHQLRPINMNGRSILAVTSELACPDHCHDAGGIAPSSSGQALTTADHFRLDFGCLLISHVLSSMWLSLPSMTSNRRNLACSPPFRMSEGGPRVSRLCRTWLTWSGGIVRKRGRHRATSSISAVMEPWSSPTHSRDSVRMS